MEVLREESKYKSPPDGPSFHCPSCHSIRIYKDGFRSTAKGKVQRHLCRDCGLRFSNPVSQLQVEVNVHGEIFKVPVPGGDLPEEKIFAVNLSPEKGLKGLTLPLSEDVASHSGEIEGQQLNTFCDYGRNHRVCADEAKNLVATETVGNVVAGEISEIKSILVQFALYMKKQGQAETTILTRGRQLSVLVKRGADINDPESVKEVIAEQIWVNKRKQNACDTYSCFLTMLGKTWSPPHYKAEQKIPFIPTEEEIDTLINESGPKTSTFLLLLKETAVRAGEAQKLMWTDVDFERNVIRITPEKGSRARIFNVSSKLINKLAALKTRNNVTDSKRVFSKLLRTIRRIFMVKRKRLATLYNNPRLLQIHFHTFRHWKATTLYHQTKDLLYVQRFLGHRSISNTMLYIQIEEALFGGESDQYVCKVARTIEEALPLLELGFTEASDFDGVKIYRKPKNRVH